MPTKPIANGGMAKSKGLLSVHKISKPREVRRVQEEPGGARWGHEEIGRERGSQERSKEEP